MLSAACSDVVVLLLFQFSVAFLGRGLLKLNLTQYTVAAYWPKSTSRTGFAIELLYYYRVQFCMNCEYCTLISFS